MKTTTRHTYRPVFTARDRANMRVIADSVSRYFDGTDNPRPVNLPPGVTLRSDRTDPALHGVNPELAGVR